MGVPALLCVLVAALLRHPLAAATAIGGGEMVVQPDELLPEFLAPLENITASQGRDVTFTCVVNHLGRYKEQDDQHPAGVTENLLRVSNPHSTTAATVEETTTPAPRPTAKQYSVAWIKSDSKAILAIHTHLVSHNPRLTVTHNGHNTWKLHINSVQRDDSGIYMCQVNTDPMRSQKGYLDVVVPPDILSNESLDSGTAPEGGTVRLRCVATGVPAAKVTWRREDAKDIVLRHDGGRDKSNVHTFEGETLTLTNVQRTDMGVYLCIASNGVPPSVSKRFPVTVLFPPLVKVSNQLVAAPMGSDVTINCYVEASPGAMCSWFKDTDSKLLPSDKYSMSETPSGYSLTMNLTIRSLQITDFGSYVCAASNALGRAEGNIRLQVLHLPPKTTTAATDAHALPTTRKKLLPHHKDAQAAHTKRKKNRDPSGTAGGQQEEAGVDGGGRRRTGRPQPNQQVDDGSGQLPPAFAAMPSASTPPPAPGGLSHQAAATRPTPLFYPRGAATTVNTLTRLPWLSPLVGVALTTALWIAPAASL